MKIFSKELLYRILPVEWTQPTLTSNGVFGGNQMAVDWTYGANNGVSGTPYQAFGSNSGELYIYRDERKTWMKIFMYIPRPIKVRSISFFNRTVFASSGAATNIKLYGGYAKDDNREVIKDIGTVNDNTSYSGAVTTNSEYQYYTLYLENWGSAYNDSICIRNIIITGEYDDFV